MIGLHILIKLHFAKTINDTQLSRVHTCILITSPGCILIQKFPKLFDSETLGHAKNFVLSSATDATITPVISEGRSCPFAMKDHVEKEVRKVCSLGVLQPCTNAIIDWANPHVVPWKKNGKVGFAVTYEKSTNQ